jgi:hypothetical protein
MMHIATLFSFLALLACSKHESAAPAAKPVETPAASTTIAATYGGALPGYNVYPGARQELVFASGAARAAFRRATDPAGTVRLLAAGPSGVTELRSSVEPGEIAYGLFAAGDDVVAVESLSDPHTGETYVAAWRIVLQNGDVVVTQSFEADSPSATLPRWIPASVRERTKIAAAAAGERDAEMEAARAEINETEEEAEEGNMTDAIEEFEAPGSSAPHR